MQRKLCFNRNCRQKTENANLFLLKLGQWSSEWNFINFAARWETHNIQRDSTRSKIWSRIMMMK